MKLEPHMPYRFFWMAVGLLICGLSACQASNSGSGGALGHYAAAPASEAALPDEVEAQVKSHPGSVAAPTPDPVDTVQDAVKGTQEILCRSEDPIFFQVHIKGQVFEGLKSGDVWTLVPCLDCAGKKLRVVTEEGDDYRFYDGKIQEGGYFELTFKTPDPRAVSFHVIPTMDPYLWSQSPEEKGSCPHHACIQNSVMELKHLLDFEESSLETAPICNTPLKIIKKTEPPISF